MSRKIVFFALALLLVFAVAVPVVAPDVSDILVGGADNNTVTIEHNDSLQPYQSADPQCPPGSGIPC